MRSRSPCWSLPLLLLALALPPVSRAQETYTSPVFQVTLQPFNPETHTLEYVDRQLCFAVDVPADWTSDGIPGSFAWFGLRAQEQPSFNISTDNSVAPTLEQALA